MIDCPHRSTKAERLAKCSRFGVVVGPNRCRLCLDGWSPGDRVPADFTPEPVSVTCSTCGPKRVTWLGIDWWGKPWPLRWSWNPYQMTFDYRPSAGCGCIARLKEIAAWIRLNILRAYDPRTDAGRSA